MTFVFTVSNHKLRLCECLSQILKTAVKVFQRFHFHKNIMTPATAITSTEANKAPTAARWDSDCQEVH